MDTVGERIIELIIQQRLFTINHPDPEASHVFVWSSGAAELIEAVVDEVYGKQLAKAVDVADRFREDHTLWNLVEQEALHLIPETTGEDTYGYAVYQGVVGKPDKLLAPPEHEDPRQAVQFAREALEGRRCRLCGYPYDGDGETSCTECGAEIDP